MGFSLEEIDRDMEDLAKCKARVEKLLEELYSQREAYRQKLLKGTNFES
jgi:prefoldin subunit 5